MGCDFQQPFSYTGLEEFQSTHPHGVRLFCIILGVICTKFQSTHPHGVRLSTTYGYLPRYAVSIHAPTWGATFLMIRLTFTALFQSTHPHGVRPYLGLEITELSEFQSTHPHGVRHQEGDSKDARQSFNPRTHMGCDFKVLLLLCVNIVFQSTHPHGVRLKTFGSIGSSNSFNPRTHMGCDSLFNFADRLSKGFNPRTHMGCDIVVYLVLPLLLVSIHAPTWGATYNILLSLTSVLCFNPRTHMGCDRLTTEVATITALFQSTHPHGVRHKSLERPYA